MVFVLLVVMIFIFANYGIQIFGGKLAKCNDEAIVERRQCVGLYKRNLKTLNHNKLDMDQVMDFKAEDLEAEEPDSECVGANSDEDIVFIKKTRQTNNSKRKISIERLRSLVADLGRLVCEIGLISFYLCSLFFFFVPDLLCFL